MHNTLYSAKFSTALAALIMVLSLCSATLLPANPGDLDSTFSGDGKASLDIFGMNDHIFAMGVQQDGKIVAAGRSFLGGATFGTIVRLKTDGTPDPDFNGGGVVFANVMFEAGALLIQPDGKIIIGGIRTSFNDFVLIRYDSSGNPDDNFGQNGVVYTDLGTAEEQVRDMALQKDGKIVVVGDGSNGAFLVARYNTDGSPDSGFGTGGQQTLPVPQASDVVAAALLIQPTGKIVVAGSASFSGHFRFVLMRVNANGTPDATFTTETINPYYGEDDYVFDMADLGNGRITVLGISKDTNAVEHIRMINYGIDGNYLQGNNPNAIGDIGGHALAVRPDGKIMVAGYSGDTMALFKYTVNLALDSSFGIGGIKTIDFAGNYDGANAIVIQSDGHIVAGGDTLNATRDVAFARVDGFNTPLLADDFSGAGPAWTVVNGNWTETADSLIGYGQSKPATVFAPLPWSPSGLSSCIECTILFPISTTGGASSKIVLYAWYQDRSESVQLILKPKTGKWTLKQKSGSLVRKDVVKKAIEAGVVYNVGLSYDGDSFLLSIDGFPILKQPALKDFSGNVGFKVSKTTVQIDHVYIY